MMQIEKGVKIPNTAGQSIYPWADMDHGDSFLVECKEGEHHQKQNAVTTAGHRWLKRHKPGWKLVSRTLAEGIRVWIRNPEVDA